jgi:hypothetical protein
MCDFTRLLSLQLTPKDCNGGILARWSTSDDHSNAYISGQATRKISTSAIRTSTARRRSGCRISGPFQLPQTRLAGDTMSSSWVFEEAARTREQVQSPPT